MREGLSDCWASTRSITRERSLARAAGNHRDESRSWRARRVRTTMKAFDVIVVGARCAGAATALLLARAGARVLLVDKGAHGTDILSTHALMRGAVLQLQRWGVL